jgi:UDP-N-acetylmuramate dehydrogenase
LISIVDIKTHFRGEILINEPLSKYTSYRIGGPASLFLVPVDKSDAVDLSVYLQKNKIEFGVIGNGTNVLVSDNGVDGIVMNLEKGLNKISKEKNIVIADSGVMLARFVDFCIQNKFTGVEKLSGIPGTLGGAILMNASAFGASISDYIVEIEVVRNGDVILVKKNDSLFEYRNSGFKNDVILSAKFDLPPGDSDEMIKIRHEYLQKRNQKQPLNYPNCGSVFKNPVGHHAAKLIEDAGLKGIRVGDAQVSEKHGNFIVNIGEAKANDVIQLINKVRKIVFDKFGIVLELEVKLIGFEKDVVEAI